MDISSIVESIQERKASKSDDMEWIDPSTCGSSTKKAGEPFLGRPIPPSPQPAPRVAPSRVLAYPLPSPTRTAAIGWAYWGSVSHGNRIQVSWLTSVTKVSTIGRPAGLA